MPTWPVTRGYTRLFGPWLMHAAVATSADAVLAGAAATAATNIAASIPYLSVMSHVLYPTTRTTVTGTVVVTDGRPAFPLWALLSTATAPTVYELHEPTYFVRTAANGSFSIPGVPPGNYTLYVSGAPGGACTITDVLRRPSVLVAASAPPVTALGVVSWTPSDARDRILWSIGGVDRSGSEFKLGASPRDWYLPGAVPGTLTFTVGSSREAADWYYAQTQGGTWTVKFNLPTTYSGTATLAVSASMTQGDSPTVRGRTERDGVDGEGSPACVCDGG